jgi:SAM-dependent methyltransferase
VKTGRLASSPDWAAAGAYDRRVRDTKGDDYASRLQANEGIWWKRLLDVQAPYRWNMRRQHLGRTLDVGCGIGRNLERVGPGSVGVDHNPASVGIARSRGLSAMTVEEWESSELRVPDSFDAILLAHVVEHMSEDEAVALLEDYLPYLRPGGRVFFVCPQERGYASDPTHVRFTDLDALRDLALVAGLIPGRGWSFPFPRVAGRAFTYNEFCLLASKL